MTTLRRLAQSLVGKQGFRTIKNVYSAFGMGVVNRFK